MEMDICLDGGKKVNARVRGFTITTDQPVMEGGGDAAPTPFEVFIASLGACAGFYAVAYCSSRRLPTAGVRLKLRAGRSADGRRLETVHIDILVPPAFSEKDRRALVRTVNGNAVKKALLDPPEVIVACKTGGA